VKRKLKRSKVTKKEARIFSVDNDKAIYQKFGQNSETIL